MSAFSDFLENRLLEASLGNTTYVVPHVIKIGTLDSTNGVTYDVVINGTTFTATASGAETEADLLNTLQTNITGVPVTATRFVDVDGAEALKVSQDGTWANVVVTASSTGGSGTMTNEQQIYVALFTTDPTDADAGTEVSAGGYTREIGTFTTATAGASENTADITFGPASASWGTVTHVGILDDFTAGNLLYHGALTTSKTVADSDSFVFRTGDLDLSLD